MKYKEGRLLKDSNSANGKIQKVKLCAPYNPFCLKDIGTRDHNNNNNNNNNNNKSVSAYECAFELFVYAGSLFAIFCNCFSPVFTIYYVI